jgi:predicted component of type VI protein secretion system
MDFQLRIVRGRAGAETLKLGDGITVVGRHDDCQLRIKSSQVSRRHCELFEKKGLLLVKDLGSSNGTYVNGKKIESQQVLEPGDEITVGQVRLRVEKLGAPPAAKAAPPAVPPGDTAISEAIPLVGDDDNIEIDFDFDFDEEPAPLDDIPLSDEEPATVTPAAKAPPAPAADSKKAEDKPKESGSSQSGLADDAVADFLMGLKIDDDE